MGRIYNNITELVGNTPLVRLGRVNDTQATIVAKLEFFNPGQQCQGSDRAGDDRGGRARRNDHAW